VLFQLATGKPPFSLWLEDERTINDYISAEENKRGYFWLQKHVAKTMARDEAVVLYGVRDFRFGS
jgi:hypothetical protein